MPRFRLQHTMQAPGQHTDNSKLTAGLPSASTAGALPDADDKAPQHMSDLRYSSEMANPANMRNQMNMGNPDFNAMAGAGHFGIPGHNISGPGALPLAGTPTEQLASLMALIQGGKDQGGDMQSMLMGGMGGLGGAGGRAPDPNSYIKSLGGSLSGLDPKALDGAGLLEAANAMRAASERNMLYGLTQQANHNLVRLLGALPVSRDMCVWISAPQKVQFPDVLQVLRDRVGGKPARLASIREFPIVHTYSRLVSLFWQQIWSVLAGSGGDQLRTCDAKGRLSHTAHLNSCRLIAASQLKRAFGVQGAQHAPGSRTSDPHSLSALLASVSQPGSTMPSVRMQELTQGLNLSPDLMDSLQKLDRASFHPGTEPWGMPQMVRLSYFCSGPGAGRVCRGT